jgi:spore coat protein U-like protein
VHGRIAVRKLLLSILAAAGVLLLATTSAEAQTCSFGVTDADFGTVDTLAGAPESTTATITITCGGLLNLGQVQVCIHLGAGAGGSTGGVRHMRNGTNDPLDYILYQDAGYATPWGATATPALGNPLTLTFPLPILGQTIVTQDVYAEVQGGQQTAVPGVYSSLFSGAHARVDYDVDLLPIIFPPPPCSAGGHDATTNLTFSVLANVDPNCDVTADNIDFGEHGVLAAPVPAQGEVRVVCTPGTAYTVALNGGLAGAPPTLRLMTLSAASIVYGLYKDSGYGQPWGDTGGDVVAGTGTGVVEALPIYALVPAQTTPAPGVYRDTVVVTVTY